MKRAAQPALSPMGELLPTRYEQRLRVEEDLSAVTIRNYLSDLRQFAAWCEFTRGQGCEDAPLFTPERVTTPTLIDYRTYLQQTLLLKPNSVNRFLLSIKRYFAWLAASGLLRSDPARSVPLHRLAQIMGHDCLDTTRLYVREAKQDLQQEVERIAWR